MLHSINFIRYFINKKNKENYIKNGGGYMAYVQYEKNLEKQKDIQKIQDLMDEINKETPEENKTKNSEQNFDNSNFLRIVLEKELENSLNNFNVCYAEKIENKIKEINNKQKILNVKNILKDFKDKPKQDLMNFVLDNSDLKSKIGEEWLTSLIDWLNDNEK